MYCLMHYKKVHVDLAALLLHTHIHLVWLHAKVVVLGQQVLRACVCVIAGHDGEGQLDATS